MKKPKAIILPKEKSAPKNTKKPSAQSTNSSPEKPATQTPQNRGAKAFAPQKAQIKETEDQKHWDTGFDKNAPTDIHNPGAKKSSITNWLIKLCFSAFAVLISLGLSLMADRLLSDLFSRNIWLGQIGIAALSLLVIGVILLALREILALKSLKNLDSLRIAAQKVLVNDIPEQGREILLRLNKLYRSRADLAKARQNLNDKSQDLLDGAAIIEAAEYHLMAPLDKEARNLTAASARRVAIVTAISPRAIVDLAFVSYESLKLARAIAALYGAKPGFFGSWRLAGAILSHLAVTGGVALGDSVLQQMLGHGLAAKLSSRLGEGLVNGLMSVRVGIAAIKTTRPLPFDQLKPPKVMDFVSDLGKISTQETTKN